MINGASKSLDENHMMGLIAPLLCDVFDAQRSYIAESDVAPFGFQCSTQEVEAYYADRAKTVRFVLRRIRDEGVSFLTKTLPSLGKELDLALSSQDPFYCSHLRFKPADGCVYPKFLGRFWKRIFNCDGSLLPDPCVESVKLLRQVLYLFYKYELPYTAAQELKVTLQFQKTEDDLIDSDESIRSMADELADMPSAVRRHKSYDLLMVAREARYLISDLLAFFNPADIIPRHGPGAVATKQRLWGKYMWSNISDRITALYPKEDYFCSSLGNLVDVGYHKFYDIPGADLPARVVLVPKDSRGPRLISCEPVDFQWIQQGIHRALVKLVESHPLTKGVVNFTDQEPNRQRALLGSVDGSYATIDLSEASDRVSLDLVRLLFPAHIYEYLEAARSTATVLPDGTELKLRKFAPMGSALCFPILAITIWALITAAIPHRGSKLDLLVYGDDVIVPRTHVRDTIEVLEAFGLLVNRSKSCTTGLFRESCGMDAYRGVDVTPVRLRTRWSSSQSPETYCSWIAYARQFHSKSYWSTYWFIAEALFRKYGEIPDESMVGISCPSLPIVQEEHLPKRYRWNRDLQKREYRVLTTSPSTVQYIMPGWDMLLRFFVETGPPALPLDMTRVEDSTRHLMAGTFFSVQSYTHQRRSKLVRRWR